MSSAASARVLVATCVTAEWSAQYTIFRSRAHAIYHHSWRGLAMVVESTCPAWPRPRRRAGRAGEPPARGRNPASAAEGTIPGIRARDCSTSTIYGLHRQRAVPERPPMPSSCRPPGRRGQKPRRALGAARRREMDFQARCRLCNIIDNLHTRFEAKIRAPQKCPEFVGPASRARPRSLVNLGRPPRATRTMRNVCRRRAWRANERKTSYMTRRRPKLVITKF